MNRLLPSLMLVLLQLSIMPAIATDFQRERQRAPADIQKYREMLRDDPRNYEAHNNLGLAYALLEHYREAIAEYREAIRLKPDYAVAHSNLGNALADLKRFQEAIAAYRTAVRLDPTNPNYHNNLGLGLEKVGQFKAAIRELELYLKYQPEAEDTAQVRKHIRKLRGH